MPSPQIETISTTQLRELIDGSREERFTLVDVRQPEEYAIEHIPGATLIPLPELEHRLHEVDSTREVILYCRSGNRSMVAARLIADSGLGPSRLVNVAGGITAWMGRTLSGFPRLGAFALVGDDEALLGQILEMEKGAFRFYDAVSRRLPEGTFSQVTAALLQMERLHAETAYELWADRVAGQPPFEVLFEQAKGELIEGGESYERLVERVRDLDDGSTLGLAELALDIELHALDLYRAISDRVDDRRVQRDLLTLAEQEKSHIRLLSRSWR